MKIVKVPIDDLIFAEYNPRKISAVEKRNLRESISEFGLIDPIIANGKGDRKNIIIGGHQRVDVAKELGITEVDVVYLDLTEEKEKELNLRLNKYYGEFDYEKLKEYDRDMLLNIGFDTDEMRKIDEVLRSSSAEEAEVEFTSEVLEENNYVVFVFNNTMDWQTIMEKFGLKNKHSLDSKEGYRRSGIGRVVDGKELLEELDLNSSDENN